MAIAKVKGVDKRNTRLFNELIDAVNNGGGGMSNNQHLDFYFDMIGLVNQSLLVSEMPFGAYEKYAEIYSNIYTKVNAVASKAYENGLSVAGLGLMIKEFGFGLGEDFVNMIITTLIENCVVPKEEPEPETEDVEYIYDEKNLKILYEIVDDTCNKLMVMVDKNRSIDSMALYCLLMNYFFVAFAAQGITEEEEEFSMFVLPLSIMDKIIDDGDKLVNVDCDAILLTLYNQFGMWFQSVSEHRMIDFISYIIEFTETYKMSPGEYYETNGGAATFDAISELSWHNYLFCSVIDTLSGKEGSTFKMSSEKQRCNRDLVLTMLTQLVK